MLVESGRPGDPNPDVGDLSQVRVRADAGATPVFVGIGPRDAVAAYLGGSSHDRMVGFELDPFTVRYARSAGSTASPPADQRFWVATASGPGTQTLLWDKAYGPWSAVVMNADGSPGVRARADVGLRFGFLVPGGAALLGPSGVLLAGVLVRTRRRAAARSWRRDGQLSAGRGARGRCRR